MRKRFYLMTFCVVFGIMSCTETELETGASYRETYITGYLTPTYVTVNTVPEGTRLSDMPRRDKRIAVSFYGNMIREGDGDQFKKLAIQYGDTSFKRIAVPDWTEVLDDSIQSIKVETLDDFNEQYPAGSDVSDMIEMEYMSFSDYIQSGYKGSGQDGDVDFVWYGAASPYGAERSRIKKVLPEVNPSNTKLMVLPSFQLHFLRNPEKSGNHRFKLFIKMNNLDVEKQFEYDFPDSL